MNVSQLPRAMRSKIEIVDLGYTSPCWRWTAALQSKGYGSIAFGGKGRTALAHRVAYVLLVGLIPAGLQLDHLCRITACCNPAHLEPVTNKVNNERTARATKTHCVNGHPLSGDNLVIKSRGGARTPIRNCRECANARRRVQRVSA